MAIYDRRGIADHATGTTSQHEAAPHSGLDAGALAMLAQDIARPLRGITSLASALVESDLGPERSAMVNEILTTGAALQSFSDQLWDLGKLRADRLALDASDFNLLKLIRETHRRYGGLACDKGLEYDLELGAGLPGFVRGDPARLGQVIACLLSNAVSYTKTGGVGLLAEIDEDILTIEVRDTGMGVADHRRDTLFCAFHQDQPWVKGRAGGSGVSLELARRLCRRMGGDLEFAPNGSRGSVFTARIHVSIAARPFAPPEDVPDARAILKSRAWRIMVADGSAMQRKLLELNLKRFGPRLCFAENGQQLVGQFQQDPVDLIVLDAAIPILSAAEAVARIRVFERANKRKPTRVIVMSPRASKHDISALLHQGMDAHIAKPVLPGDLLTTMARLLGA